MRTRYMLEMEIRLYIARRRRMWDIVLQSPRLADFADTERQYQAEGTQYRITAIGENGETTAFKGWRVLPKGAAIRAAKASAAGSQDGRQMELAL